MPLYLIYNNTYLFPIIHDIRIFAYSGNGPALWDIIKVQLERFDMFYYDCVSQRAR